MFILSNRNILLPSQGGDETMTVKRGFIGDVPARFCETAYFSALVRDGKISLPASHRDADLEAAAGQSAEKRGRGRRKHIEAVQAEE